MGGAPHIATTGGISRSVNARRHARNERGAQRTERAGAATR